MEQVLILCKVLIVQLHTVNAKLLCKPHHLSDRAVDGGIIPQQTAKEIPILLRATFSNNIIRKAQICFELLPLVLLCHGTNFFRYIQGIILVIGNSKIGNGIHLLAKRCVILCAALHIPIGVPRCKMYRRMMSALQRFRLSAAPQQDACRNQQANHA